VKRAYITLIGVVALVGATFAIAGKLFVGLLLLCAGAGFVVGAVLTASLVFLSPFRRILVAAWNEVQVRAYVPEGWRKSDAA